MSNSLLPPNATKTELSIEASAALRLDAIPVPIRDVWNPDTCPLKLLPWLAWAFSVDSWDPNWTEAQQRQIIKNSLLIHKHKGTIGAIRRALESIGYSWKLVEWFDMVPLGPHHTFRVEIGVTDVGIDDGQYDTINRLIMDAKNVRSQLSTMLVHADVKGVLSFACAQMSGCDDEIQPYWAGQVDIEGSVVIPSWLINGEYTFVIPEGADPGDFEVADVWDGEVGQIDPAAFTLDGTYPDGGVGPIDTNDYELVGTP